MFSKKTFWDSRKLLQITGAQQRAVLPAVSREGGSVVTYTLAVAVVAVAVAVIVIWLWL